MSSPLSYKYYINSWLHLDMFVFLKGSPYSIAKHSVPQLIPVLGSHPAGDVSHAI